MTSLVFLSLVVGNYCGILATYKLAKWLGFLPPLGIRTRHMRMIGLIASMGLTVALFVSDVAFTDARLVADAKIGSLLSSVVGVVAWGISQYYDLSHELVDEQAKLQVSERAHAPTDNLISRSFGWLVGWLFRCFVVSFVRCFAFPPVKRLCSPSHVCATDHGGVARSAQSSKCPKRRTTR